MERRSSLRRYVLSPWRRATGGSYLQHPGMISFSTDLVDPSCSRFASLRATVRHPCCPLARAGRICLAHAAPSDVTLNCVGVGFRHNGSAASPAGRAANPPVELERTAYQIDVQDRRVRLITRQCTGSARDQRVKCWRDQIEGGVSVTEEEHDA